MSTKQISKDNREYWCSKLRKKFSDKRHAIESVHMVEINKTSEQNFPKFLKLLGLEKDMKELKLAENDYNSFFSSIDKKLNDKRTKYAEKTRSLSKKIKEWKENRQWDYSGSYPEYSDALEKGTHNILDQFTEYLETKCKEETKKAFYKSKKGKEIEDINAMEEKAEDLLHSDMIGAEVLRQISQIAKQSKIAITIPQDTIKSLPNG